MLSVLYQFQPDEAVIGICNYRNEHIFVATTRRLYRVDHPDDPNQITFSVVSMLDGNSR